MNYFLRNALLDFFPAHEGMPGIADTDLDGYLRTYRRDASFTLRIGVSAAAWLYAITPIFTVKRPLIAPWLPAHLRDQHANVIARSPIYLVRQAMFLLKTVGGLCWGAHPKARNSIGLPAYENVPNQWRQS